MSLEAVNSEEMRFHAREAQARLAKENGKSSFRLPRVLRCLFEEHRHLAALLRALEGKAQKKGRLNTGDYYLMRDIVGYLHDYPDHVHHPTENRLFEKLLQREPSRKKAVKRLRDDHRAVAHETQTLLNLLDQVIEDSTRDKEKAVRMSCEAFISHQRAHMQFENQEMFPAAIDSLSPADWKQIEIHFEAADDPLFGQIVGSKHRLLYEYLMSPAAQASGKFQVSRFFSLERLILTVDALEEGTGTWCNRIKNLGEDVSQETRALVTKSLKPESLTSVIGLPVNYAAFLGKSLFDCTGDLVQIYSSTVKKSVKVLFSQEGS